MSADRGRLQHAQRNADKFTAEWAHHHNVAAIVVVIVDGMATISSHVDCPNLPELDRKFGQQVAATMTQLLTPTNETKPT